MSAPASTASPVPLQSAHGRRSCARPCTLLCLLLATAACAGDTSHGRPYSPAANSDYPLAGLHVPGSQLGFEPAASGADGGGGLSAEEQREIEDSLAAAGGEDRCQGAFGAAGTRATLAIAFHSDSYGGFYEPENCGAVWIENAAGQYVATPGIWAKVRLRNLFIWNGRRCEDDAPDVVSSATLADHETAHDFEWDGVDQSGAVAPDGDYVLNIEVTEDELNYGRRSQFPFTKGAEAFTLEPDDTETVRGLSMQYTPAEAAQ